MFRQKNTLTYQSPAVFWREVLSAHKRKFHGCSIFQFLTKRLWPRAVPWVCIKILSGEIVGANRLAYPSERWDQSKDPREEAKDEARRKREEREMSSVERSNVRSELKNPLLSKKKIERGNASARLDRDASSVVRHVIGIPTRSRASSSSNFALLRCCRRYVTASRSRVASRSLDKVSKNMCVCVYVWDIEVFEWNETEPRLMKSRRDYDDTHPHTELITTGPLARLSIAQRYSDFLVYALPYCRWNITPADIVSARDGNQPYARGKLRRDRIRKYKREIFRIFGATRDRKIKPIQKNVILWIS